MNQPKQFQLEEIESSIGVIMLVTDESSVRAIDFADFRERMDRLLTRHYGAYQMHAVRKRSEARVRLESYLAGDLAAIETIRVQTNGSEFQKKVWSALRTIPVGTTTTYGAIAKQVGNANSSRAVGLANGSNPISIVVPCHRVVGANTKLTGYAGGLVRKEWLLQHERGNTKERSIHECSTQGSNTY
jgi:methylated-DNA-[protein]-cysteine S-methyltransferase